jgi:RNA polymerase sigma-70 factor (ECF subfamily)
MVKVLPLSVRRRDAMQALHREMAACTPALLRYAWTLVRNGPDADDLVHDSLVRALDRAHTRNPDLPARPWLFAIMHNLFITDMRRRNARGVRIPLEDLAEEEPLTPAGQEHGLSHRNLLRGLDALPEEQRMAILLVSVEDFSYEAAAQVLGVPVGTVMSRISRGRERLRRAMEGEPMPKAAGRGGLQRVK